MSSRRAAVEEQDAESCSLGSQIRASTCLGAAVLWEPRITTAGSPAAISALPEQLLDGCGHGVVGTATFLGTEH